MFPIIYKKDLIKCVWISWIFLVFNWWAGLRVIIVTSVSWGYIHEKKNCQQFSCSFCLFFVFRYVAMAMKQDLGRTDPLNFARFASESCQETGRDGLGGNGGIGSGGNLLDSFRREFRLGEPIAANYFTVEHDSFVDGINAFCHNKAWDLIWDVQCPTAPFRTLINREKQVAGGKLGCTIRLRSSFWDFQMGLW